MMYKRYSPEMEIGLNDRTRGNVCIVGCRGYSMSVFSGCGVNCKYFEFNIVRHDLTDCVTQGAASLDSCKEVYARS